MEHIREIYEMIRGKAPKTLAVACAADTELLKAVAEIRAMGFIRARLYGNVQDVTAALNAVGESAGDYELIAAGSEEQAAELAVRDTREGTADIVMKGLMSSPVFIKAILNKEYGIRSGKSVLSAIAAAEITVDGEDKVVFIADPGFVTAPDLETKKQILLNTCAIMRTLGYNRPKVAVLSANEVVNPKMASSVEARALQEMAERGELGECEVCGPLSLDLAISPRAAAHKHFSDPVAGAAELLLVPTIEVGNCLIKAFNLIGNKPGSGAVAGTTKPVVFTSRADSYETKRNTIATAILMADRMRGNV